MNISEIEVNSIRFGKLEDSIRAPSAKIAVMSYERDRTPLNATSPEFITETYGIPREGPYYQTDRSRAFFKMPSCHKYKKHEDPRRGDSLGGAARGCSPCYDEIDYAEIEACYNKLREIDDFLFRKEFRLQLFGEKNADKYEYQPIVHTVEDLEDAKNNFRPPYAKFKLELAYDDDSPTCKVFDKKHGVRTEVALNEFKEALQYI